MKFLSALLCLIMMFALSTISEARSRGGSGCTANCREDQKRCDYGCAGAAWCNKACLVSFTECNTFCVQRL